MNNSVIENHPKSTHQLMKAEGEDLIIRLAKLVQSELLGADPGFKNLVFQTLVKIYFPG